MTANSNPYMIIPIETADRMLTFLDLAVSMARGSYPHLVEGFEMTIEMYKEQAISFIGDQNIPTSAKQAYINK